MLGRDAKTGELLSDTTSCAMCRRVIINAGIKEVVTRTGEGKHAATIVQDWIFLDDSLNVT